jgi:ABC-type Mn2+/Zn2+ transport system permease subunit/Mn-dependent DtxR family transcriptional regulator
MSDPLLALSLLHKALLTATLLGMMCGLLGTFVVMRRISLVGDAVSHAILPGIVLGFIVSTMIGDDRNPWIIFTCATIIGLFSMLVVRQILATTRLKADTALGIVLSGFFGIGLFMKRSLIDFMSTSSGLDNFLFGNLATISDDDLKAILIVATLLIAIVCLLLRPFSLISFDALFAQTIGFPVRLLNLVFYFLLTLTIVVSVRAVGVVLVSSMLIIPAASAFLLTERNSKMMWLSMGFGAMSGLIGCYLSSSVTNANVPNGATMTLIATSIFLTAYLAAPHHGVLAKWLKRRNLEATIRSENTLKAIYKWMEDSPSTEHQVTTQEFVAASRNTASVVEQTLRCLNKKNLLHFSDNRLSFTLTDSGLQRGMEIVRNHRLWELYLTRQADYENDHVHDDAELIEHLLDEDTVKKLEAELNFPVTDPHGKTIPRSVAAK